MQHWAWVLGVLSGSTAVFFGACSATSEPVKTGGTDAGKTPVYDSGSNTSDGGGTCTLGTPDHCGTCDTVCPGTDNAGTQRTCTDATSSGVCDIVCKGEWYDVNGSLADGCEGQDPIIHDTPDAAVPESAGPAGSGGYTVGAPYWYLYGDARIHDVPPTSRPLGRADWYAVSHPDSGPLGVCLSINGFPSDDRFQVCVSNAGDPHTPATLPCIEVSPTTDAGLNCVTPQDGGHVAGTYYVVVTKVDGSNSADGYALYLQD